MRRALIAVALLLALPRVASAQTCDCSPSLGARGIGLRASVAVEHATYHNDRYEGEWEGLRLGMEWTHRWVRLRASLTGYRIARNGLDAYGIGDLLLEARAPVARTQSDSVVFGLGVSGTAPTGDPAKDLGMGHAMLMGGAWLEARLDRFLVDTRLGYGRMLMVGTSAHHHTSGPAPIVDPMNASELEASAMVDYRLLDSPGLHLRGGLYGALPIGTPGVARAVAVAGVVTTIKWADVGLEGHLPLAGDPFVGKLVVTAGARF